MVASGEDDIYLIDSMVIMLDLDSMKVDHSSAERHKSIKYLLCKTLASKAQYLLWKFKYHL